MFSATAMPSSSALCASIGPGITSPIAQMPATFGPEIVIDLDLAALVGLEAGLVEVEAFGVGAPADRDEDDVGLERLRRAALGRLDGQV